MSDNVVEKINSRINSLTEEQKKALIEKLRVQSHQHSGETIPVNSDTLSHAQRRLWILEQFNHCDYLYHVPLIMTLDRHTDRTILQQAFHRLAQENPVLTSSFLFVDDQITQRYDPQCHIALSTITLDSDLPDFVEPSDDSVLSDFFLKKFDLDTAPLVRVAVLETPKQLFLAMCFHHIIVDGWSVHLIINQLGEHYDALLRQQSGHVNVSNNDYVAFVEWEKTRPPEPMTYWSERLKDNVLVVDLITDYPRKIGRSGHGKTRYCSLPTDLVERLQDYVKCVGITMNQLLLFAFELLLSRYSGQDQITVGIPIAGRVHRRWYDTIGLFVNTFLHSTTIDYQRTVCEQLMLQKSQLFNDIAHATQPFDDVVKALYAQKQLNPNGVFNILYNFIQADHENSRLMFAEAPCTLHYCALPISKFDLSLHVYAANNTLDLFIEFSTDLYQENTIIQMEQVLLRILTILPDHNQATLSEFIWSLAN